MALTAPVSLRKRPGDMIEFAIGTGTTVFVGAAVMLASGTGRIENLADTAGAEPVGFVTELVPLDSSDGSAAGVTAGTTKVVVDTNPGIHEDETVVGVVSEVNVGELVYATDENTFTLTATTNIPAVGMVARHKTGTTVDVLFFSAEEMRNN